jgi:hypothetical protein
MPLFNVLDVTRNCAYALHQFDSCLRWAIFAALRDCFFLVLSGCTVTHVHPS